MPLDFMRDVITPSLQSDLPNHFRRHSGIVQVQHDEKRTFEFISTWAHKQEGGDKVAQGKM